MCRRSRVPAHAMMNEVLSSLRVVAQEEHEHSRFEKKSRGLMKEHVRVSMIQGFFDLAIVVTIAAGTATTLYVGVLHVQAGRLTLGELVLLLTYVAQLYDPLQVVSKKLADLQASMVSAERAFMLLDQAPDVSNAPMRSLLQERADMCSSTTFRSPTQMGRRCCEMCRWTPGPACVSAFKEKPAPARARF